MTALCKDCLIFHQLEKMLTWPRLVEPKKTNVFTLKQPNYKLKIPFFFKILTFEV